MDKLVDITWIYKNFVGFMIFSVPNTQILYLTQNVGVLEKSSGEASNMLVHLSHFSLTTSPGPLGLGSWPSIPLTWPGLCLHLGRVLLLLRVTQCPVSSSSRAADGHSAALLPPTTPVMDILRLFKLYLLSK